MAKMFLVLLIAC